MKVTEERLAELVNELDQARSVVYVSAQALDQGDTDFELQSATALKKAFETMDCVYDSLQAMRLEVGSEERESRGEVQ